jgi:hypothetical protein
MVKMMINGTREIESSEFDVMERCETGGCCFMISRSEWAADALRRAAGEKF